MTFNHAIDLFARGEDKMCQKWALKAMELAAFMMDDGQMKQLLEAKFSKLRFQNALS
jgi:hypothetical protein